MTKAQFMAVLSISYSAKIM